MMKQIPNYLTMFRIASVVVVYLSFYVAAPLGHWLAVTVFALGAITDFFDGYLARKFDALSDFGRMFDPIADKLMVLICLVMLISANIITLAHLPAALIIIAREILVSGLREFLNGRDVTLPVSTLAKYKTSLQMIALGCLLAQNKLQLARIGVDITDRINAVLIGGEFFSIHLDQIFVQIQPPIGNRSQLHG